MRTYLDVCDYTQWLCEHCKRICTESQLWEENPLPRQGIEPLSVLHQAFWSDILIPTELPCPYCVSQYSQKTTGINVSPYPRKTTGICVSQYSWKTTGICVSTHGRQQGFVLVSTHGRQQGFVLVSTHGRQQGCPHGSPSCCQRHSLNCEWRKEKREQVCCCITELGWVGAGCFGGTS